MITTNKYQHVYELFDTYVKVTIVSKFKIYHTLLDLDDWDWLQEYPLSISCHKRGTKESLALCTKNDESKTCLVHRIILNAPDGAQVDHIEGNTLDNRKEKLRLASNAENHQNRHTVHGLSTARGVYYMQSINRLIARCTINGRSNYLGCFKTEKEAADTASTFREKHMPFSKEARGEY